MSLLPTSIEQGMTPDITDNSNANDVYEGFFKYNNKSEPEFCAIRRTVISNNIKKKLYPLGVFDFKYIWELRKTYNYRFKDFPENDIINGNPIDLTIVVDGFDNNLTWTIGSNNHKGHIIERSIDNITFEPIGVVINNKNTYTDIVDNSDTNYYYRVVAFKNLIYSDYSNVVNSYVEPWYLSGGINLSDVVGVYVAKGAGSKQLSLRNIANPGVNDLTESGNVSWNSVDGWSGFSETNFLTGVSYKAKTYSILALFSSLPSIEPSRVVSNETTNGTDGMYIIPVGDSTQGFVMQNGSYLSFPKKQSGVLGVNQTNVFSDGVSIGTITPSGEETIATLRIGNCAYSGALWNYFTGKIKAVVVYNKSITNEQMIAVSQKMLSESFVADNFRNFSTLTRYANNPIISHNTNIWDTYNTDAPYINLANKIGDTFYAPSQVSATNDTFNDILMYRSTDLINWEISEVNPIISHTIGAWDHKYLLHPCIIKIGATWTMYYSAEDSTGKHRIGIATSPDLINWTKYASNPVYSRPGNASVPWVILIGSTYFMYYWNRLAGNSGLIEYATSPDGYTWTYGGNALPRKSTEWDYGTSILDPYVNKRSDGIYEMVYTSFIYSSGIIQKIGYAISWDGIKWYKYDSFILEKGTLDFEKGYVGDPVLIDNPITGKGNLFYVGCNNDVGESNSDGALAIIL